MAWGKNDGDNTNANIVAKEKEHGNILLLVAMITAGGEWWYFFYTHYRQVMILCIFQIYEGCCSIAPAEQPPFFDRMYPKEIHLQLTI